MTQRSRIGELRRLNAECVATIEQQRRLRNEHAAALAGYLAEQTAFENAHPGSALPSVLRYSIEAGEGGVVATGEEIAELETMLAEQRAALAAAVGEPVEVFATHVFSFIDQDGSERLCRRNQVHRLLPPAAAMTVDAGVALAANSLAGLRAREAAAGDLDLPETNPVRLGDPVGFGFVEG